MNLFFNLLSCKLCLNSYKRSAKFLLIGSFVFLSLFSVMHEFLLSSVYAQYLDEGTTYVQKHRQIITTLIDGKPQTKEQEIEIEYYVAPQPKLENCQKSVGVIHWNDRFKYESKISPALQTRIDSGTTTQCVVVVLNHNFSYGKLLNFHESGKLSKYGQIFIDLQKKIIAQNPTLSDVVKTKYLTWFENKIKQDLMQPSVLSVDADVYGSTLNFLKQNGAIFEKNSQNTDEVYMYINALIPTSLIGEITKKSDVALLDVYGKIPAYDYPNSKVSDLLRSKINSGLDSIMISIRLKQIDFWPNGKPIDAKNIDELTYKRNEERRKQTQEMQQPLIEFLNKNNATVTFVDHGINVVRATVPVSLIPELEQRQDVILLDIPRVGTLAGFDKETPNKTPSSSRLDLLDNEFTISYSKTTRVDISPAVVDPQGRLQITSIKIPGDFLKKQLDVFVDGNKLTSYSIKKQGIYTILNLIPNDPKNQDNKHCKDGFILITSKKGKSACVSPQTKKILETRGWI